MYRFAFLLALVAATTLAQPSVTRGGTLKKRAYQTYSALTFYVDPTGSDSNACTASGTEACATLMGALNKIPLNVRHTVIINVAAGTYTETVAFPTFNFVRSSSSVSGSITVTGAARTAPTLASGTTSGTLTSPTTSLSVSNGASSFTDSTQTWTVDNLVGSFIEMTSGALSGQVCPISSNTSTTVFTSCVGSGGLAGDTYAIRVPSSNFVGAWRIGGFGGVATNGVALVDLALSSSVASGLSVFSNMGTVVFTRCKLTSSLVEGTAFSVSSRFTATSSIFQGVTTNGAVLFFSGGSAAPPLVSLAASTVINTGTAVALGFTGLIRATSNLYGVVRGSPSATVAALSFTAGTGSANLGYPWAFVVTCSVGSAGLGIGASTSSFRSNFVLNLSTRVENCATGVSLQDENSMEAQLGLYFVNTTTGISLTRGAHADLYGFAPSFSGVTNELQLDGENFTYSFLNGLSPGVITSPLGSRIIK